MPIYLLTLREREEVARDTIMLRFDKPAGFVYQPGQYGGFTLINPTETDAKGNTRRFSLASSPQDDYLAVVTRLQPSVYKQQLKTLAIGSTIKFAGPTGTFTLHEDKTIPAVFLAGGIGIAPFYSMIRASAQQNSSQSLQLFYGNQNVGDAAFLAELTALQMNHPSFQIIPAMANPDPSWQGEQGFISFSMIKKYHPQFTRTIFYICGSLTMVNAMQTMLTDAGISSAQIRVEDFPGY